MKKGSNRSAGFTLVELIVVIAILAILAGIAIPVYSGYIKKANQAADNMLLAAVNTAYAAACMENGTSARDVARASANLSGSEGALKLTGVSPYNDSFAKYYAGNESSTFKYFKSLKWDKTNGVFVGDEVAGGSSVTVGDHTYVYDQADVDAYLASNYTNASASELTGAVDMLSAALSDNRNALAKLANTPEFNQMLVDMGIISSGTVLSGSDLNASLAKEIANASVLFVAEKSSELDPATVYEKFKNGQSLDTMLGGSGVDSLFVSTAIKYGLMTAFVNSEYGSSYKDEFNSRSAGVTNLATANALYEWISDDDNTFGDFYAYMNNVDGANAAQKDISGFIGALNVINGNSSNFDLTTVFSNPDIIEAINTILGGH